MAKQQTTNFIKVGDIPFLTCVVTLLSCLVFFTLFFSFSVQLQATEKVKVHLLYLNSLNHALIQCMQDYISQIFN